jgi:Fe-S cluster assembly ATP-binding protein
VKGAIETRNINPEEYLERELSGTLSGGELKRIEIASVLARNTDVMIFDEPEAGIDLWSFNDLVDVFKKIRKNKIIIIISHQERIIKLADRVLVLENGSISKECSPEEFLKGVV